VFLSLASGARIAPPAAGRRRHPAQVIVSSRSALSIETGLMFQEPELRVFLMTTSKRSDIASPSGRHPSLDRSDRCGTAAVDATRTSQVEVRGIATVSAIGGRRTATSLLDEGLVQDLYLTTAPTNGGEPDTPMYKGEIDAVTVLEKGGHRERRGSPIRPLACSGGLKPTVATRRTFAERDLPICRVNLHRQTAELPRRDRSAGRPGWLHDWRRAAAVRVRAIDWC
jgi:hypothetical protein